MTDPDELLDLVGEIYDCAIEPADWPAVLERIALQVHGINASISVQDPLSNAGRFSATWGVPEHSIATYNETYAALNPVMTSGWFCDIDEPISAARFAGEDAYFRSRFGREFLAPLGWGDAIGSHLMKMADRYGILCIFGPWDRGSFGDEELLAIRRLSPHVRRAITIADLLDARALRQDMLSATLDLLTVAIVLTDDKGRIAHANRAGLAALDARNGVRRDGDHLATNDPRSAHDLRSAIVAASHGDTSAMPASGIAVPIANRSEHGLAAWVLPLDAGLRRDLAAPFAARVAVFLRELGDTSPFPGELFVKRYAITPAECRALMMLVKGMGPAEAADCLGVSLPTIKTHLSRLFEKTGTTSQSDLMRLAVTALAPARRPGASAPE